MGFMNDLGSCHFKMPSVIIHVHPDKEDSCPVFAVILIIIILLKSFKMKQMWAKQSLQLTSKPSADDYSST